MDKYTIDESQYKNGYRKGYEDGKKDSVKHGRWELHGDYDDLSGSYFCSQCGYNMDEAEYFDNFSHFRYCPNCGARMDGEKGEQT